jgi:hypothetical protein
MKAILRLMLPVALASWLALPGIGGDGGENAGGTGVWILPRPTFMASGSPCITGATQARGATTVANVNEAFALTAAEELGAFTATLIDPVSGVPMALPTSGRSIVLGASLLRDLQQAGVAASIVIADSQQLGYVMRLTFDAATGVGTIHVF